MAHPSGVVPPTEELSFAQGDISTRPLRITVVAGPDRGKHLDLRPGSYRVGKDPTNALVLTDSAVSRAHLEIAVSADGVEVRDLGSKNGSFFRGARFDKINMPAGAAVTIGKSELQLERLDATSLLPPAEMVRFGDLLGRSDAMRRIFTLFTQLAKTNFPVLLEGETGTGKELAARALHNASRRTGSFVVCDLAGLTNSVIESELFGHVQGSFTGADQDREGAFEAAKQGTIFLDEVGELSLEVQPRLLRVLEGNHVKRIGSNKYISVDARVVAATNRELKAEVKDGAFRQDLYHRLAVVTVRLPPLRERREDIAMLVEHILAKIAEREKRSPPRVSDEAMEVLSDYDWPGNVRELRNVLQRTMALFPGEEVISSYVLGLHGMSSTSSESSVDTSIPFREAKERLIQAWERDYVETLLRQAQGNIALASRIGGIDRGYLHRLVKKYGLT